LAAALLAALATLLATLAAELLALLAALVMDAMTPLALEAPGDAVAAADDNALLALLAAEL